MSMKDAVRKGSVARMTMLLGSMVWVGQAVMAAAIDPPSARDNSVPVARAIPSPLLAIDQNRATVIDRIVGEWGAALTQSGAGIDAAQLREMLMGMRADQLLAASLAGSLEGLRNVVAAALVTDAEARPSLLQAKALGDASQDVVYVPVTPCRLVETRGTFPAVFQGGGPFASNEVRTYTLQGGNGVCLTQLPASVTPSAIQLQVFGIPTTTASGDIEILPQGSTFGSTAALVYLGNNAFTSAAVTSLANIANKQISVQVRGGGAHVAIDVVGYFRAPAGGFVSSVTAGTGLTGGTITSSGTIAVDTTVVQSRVTGTCAAGSSIRTINADGTVVCETDDGGAGGGGTVTSVGTGTGLTGGPITASGTVSIAAGGVGATQLASNAVTTVKITDSNVTTCQDRGCQCDGSQARGWRSYLRQACRRHRIREAHECYGIVPGHGRHGPAVVDRHGRRRLATGRLLRPDQPATAGDALRHARLCQQDADHRRCGSRRRAGPVDHDDRWRGGSDQLFRRGQHGAESRILRERGLHDGDNRHRGCDQRHRSLFVDRKLDEQPDPDFVLRQHAQGPQARSVQQHH
jgi:hypothetical protein